MHRKVLKDFSCCMKLSAEPKDAQAKDPGHCCVCLTAPASHTLVHQRTGHTVCCKRCAETLNDSYNNSCPICREPILSVIRVF
jgi:hypothetical protein